MEKQKPNITYTWMYDSFNITDHTADIGIIDLLKQSKLSMSTYNISFFLNNYQTFRTI